MDLDYRLDLRDGQYKLLDFNPRVGAQFRLFEDDAGMDVVRALHLDLTGRPVPRGRPIEGRAFMVETGDLLSTRGLPPRRRAHVALVAAVPAGRAPIRLVRSRRPRPVARRLCAVRAARRRAAARHRAHRPARTELATIPTGSPRRSPTAAEGRRQDRLACLSMVSQDRAALVSARRPTGSASPSLRLGSPVAARVGGGRQRRLQVGRSRGPTGREQRLGAPGQRAA